MRKRVIELRSLKRVLQRKSLIGFLESLLIKKVFKGILIGGTKIPPGDKIVLV